MLFFSWSKLIPHKILQEDQTYLGHRITYLSMRGCSS